MAMPGWITFGRYGSRIGWIQRKPRHWLVVLILGFLSGSHGHIEGVDTERNGDGWRNVVVEPLAFGGCLIDIRGEVDQPANDAIHQLLTTLQAEPSNGRANA